MNHKGEQNSGLGGIHHRPMIAMKHTNRHRIIHWQAVKERVNHTTSSSPQAHPYQTTTTYRMTNPHPCLLVEGARIAGTATVVGDTEGGGAGAGTVCPDGCSSALDFVEEKPWNLKRAWTLSVEWEGAFEVTAPARPFFDTPEATTVDSRLLLLPLLTSDPPIHKRHPKPFLFHR